MTQDVNVILLDFPNTSTSEAVTINEDGSYTIVINARQTFEHQQKSYQHAMAHIQAMDFEKSDVQQIEAAAHGISEPVTMRSDEFETHIKKELRRIKRRRKRLQRELAEYERTVAECRKLLGDECMFRVAENQKLYGGL